MSIREVSELTPLYININQDDLSSGERFERATTALCNKDELVDDHKILRRTLKVAASIISAGGKIAFVPVSMQLGPTLGPMSACGDSLGYFVLEYWASTGIIDDVLSPRTQAHIDLTQEERPGRGRLCRNVVVISVAAVFALASQLPVALPGIDYIEPQLKVAAGIVLMVAGTLTPLRSLQLSFNDLSQRRQRSQEAKITEIKTKIVDLLLQNQGAFIQLPHERKVELTEAFEEIRSFEGPATEKTTRYVTTLLQNLDQPLTRTQEITGKAFNYTGLALGTALAGVFEYVQGDYIYHSTKSELLDNDYLGVTLATLGVASSVYLVATSIAKTTQRIFNAVGNTFMRRESRNLSWQLRPKIAFALTGVGLITDLLAVASTFVILGNFYKDHEIERDAFITTTCTSLFLLLFTSTLDVIDDVASFSIERGTVEEQRILALSREFLQLADLIQKSPSREFIGYLTNMDQEAQTSLLERIDVSSEQLNELAYDLD